jgi:hypothetical protein
MNMEGVTGLCDTLAKIARQLAATIESGKNAANNRKAD